MEERTERKPEGFDNAHNAMVQRGILLLLLAVVATLYIGAVVIEVVR